MGRPHFESPELDRASQLQVERFEALGVVDSSFYVSHDPSEEFRYFAIHTGVPMTDVRDLRQVMHNSAQSALLRSMRGGKPSCVGCIAADVALSGFEIGHLLAWQQKEAVWT